MESRRAEKERDLEFLVSLRNEQECVKFSNRGVLTTKQVEADYFGTVNKNAYVVEENGQNIGYLICRKVSDNTYQISVALAPQERGKGYGGPMMSEAARICIEQYGANEVVAEVHANNLPSIRSMEKVGFKITKHDGPVWEMTYRNMRNTDKNK